MSKKLAALALLVALLVGTWWLLRADPSAPADARDEDAAASPAAQAAEIARERTEARARGEVDLSPCSAAGRIVDADTGRGIAGALVMLRPKGVGEPVAFGDVGAPITARSEPGGDWSVPRIAPGRYTLTATAGGYLPGARSDLSLQAGGPNPGLDLALAAGGHPLRGTVSDVVGGPVEGVVISIDRQDEGNVINFSRTSYPALSDAEGRFEVHVTDGLYRVGAWHPDYTGDDEVADVAGGPRSVELRLTPAATVEGVVLSAQDDKPVDAAIVRVGEGFAGFGDDRSAQTDAQGRFRIAGLRSGAHALQAVAAGHATREPVKIELGIGEALTGVTIRVDRAYKISGFVAPKDDSKRALSGVMVVAYSLSPTQVQSADHPSEVDGYFEILGVKPGTYTLGSVAEEALPEILGGPSVTIADADVTGVVVRLDRGVELRGRVDPPTLASVSLTLAEDEPGFLTVLSNLGSLLVRGRADATGAFSLRPIKPGRLRVVAEAPDGSRGQVDVEVGERGLDGVVVALEPRATVTGRVVDARGTPLRGGRVEFQPRERRDERTFSFTSFRDSGAPIAEDGTYAARGLDGGEYEVRVLDRVGNVVAWADAAGKPYEPVRKTIAAAVATPGVDFVVELRDGVLRGVVLDPGGAPLPDAWVTATPERSSAADAVYHRPEADKPAEKTGAVPEAPKPEETGELDFGARGEPVLSGADGRFEISGLARRTYALQAEALKGSARVRLTGVAVGSDVKLQVAPLAALSGTARAGGVLVTKYELHVRRERGGGGFSGDQKSVDRPDGVFTLDHLDPGEYKLTAVAEQGRVTQALEIAAGEDRKITLELQPWAKLRGVLLDARGGQPLAGVSVSAGQPDTFGGSDAVDLLLGRGPRTDASGRFEIARIAPGKGKLELFDGDLVVQREVATVAYEVEPGADKDLGTIYGVNVAKVPKAERGDLGLRTRVATEAARPRPPGVKVEPVEDAEDPSAPKLLWVEAVTVDGPADKAGLQPGDALLAIDGASVASLGADNAARLLAPGNVRRGQSVTFERERAGSREAVTVEAIERAEKKK